MASRLRWRDLNCEKIKITVVCHDDDGDQKRKAKLLEFLDRTKVEVTAAWDWDHGFVSKHAIMKEVIDTTNRVYKWFETNINDDEWIVVDYWSQIIGVFTPRMAEEELERRLFVELVSVPAGRFKGLLVDGGVEYQRQVARLCELKM